MNSKNGIDQFYRDWFELNKKINSFLLTGLETWYSESVTGEKYVTFGHDGIKQEGMACGCSETPEKAGKIFLEKFSEYVEAHAQKDSKIYWRIQPQMIEISKSQYYGRCRFLVSNKPEIPERLACAPNSPDGYASELEIIAQKRLIEMDKEDAKNDSH